MRRGALTIAAALSFTALTACGAGEESDDDLAEEREEDEEDED